jgi:hypothetical protein
MIHRTRDVRDRAVAEIVDSDDLVPVREEPFAKVGADKSGRPRYSNPSHLVLLSHTDIVRIGFAPSYESWAGALRVAAR